DPTGIDDNDVGRVPGAVDIQPIIEAPAVGGVDHRLRKLGTLNVRCDTDTLRLHFSHFLAGLHVSMRHAQDNPFGPPRVPALLQELQLLGWTACRNVEIDVRLAARATDSLRSERSPPQLKRDPS